MESFQWGAHFLTGLQEVDEQHRQLVEIINRLGTLLTDNVIHADDVQQLYRELAEYSRYHFHEEEQMMAELALDPRYLQHHKAVHVYFLEEVTSIYRGTNIESADSARSLLSFLIHWLAYHILGEDQDMAAQVRAIEQGMTPAQAFEQLKKDKDNAKEPLLEALNGLFLQVSLRNRELKKLNESLEEKVAERTRELYRANQQLEELSLTDVLTGLPNRRHALRHLAVMWQEAEQYNLPLVCIMIDADHFKEVNDSCGHDAGDLVLTTLAKTLQDAVRSDDLVCRLGGDEFFIICPHTDLDGGLHVAEMVRGAVARLEVATGGEPWHGSISVGVAAREAHMEQFEALIKQADDAVYAAKAAGRNCVRMAG